MGIENTNLVESGLKKIEWAESYMPLLALIKKDFIKNKPFKGLNITMSIHLEAKTANLALLMASGGANMFVTGSNPLSTQDDVVAALAEKGINIFAKYNASDEEYFKHLNLALDGNPDVIIDDGGDLINLVHTSRIDLLKNIIGGCEETTTGIQRLKAMERSGTLQHIMIAVNNAKCKYLFDNRYGTGQSVWDGINRTTNLIVAGKTCVVAGYGWCGKGVAMRAAALGAKVIICEIDPIKAIEAHMDGFIVMKMEEAAACGDIFVTVTGCNDVIKKEHFMKMKDGSVLANAGHFDVEVNVKELDKLAVETKDRRNNIKGYKLKNGNWLNLLSEGRLVNLAAGDGHPVEIMDMSFAIQALSVEYLVKNKNELGSIYKDKKLIDVPEEVDARVAGMKLSTLGIEIDELTREQKEYYGE